MVARPFATRRDGVDREDQKMGMGTAAADFEEMMSRSMQSKELEQAMKGYHEFVDHGRREIYTVET